MYTAIKSHSEADSDTAHQGAQRGKAAVLAAAGAARLFL